MRPEPAQCRIVRKLSCDQAETCHKLLDLEAKHARGEEVNGVADQAIACAEGKGEADA